MKYVDEFRDKTLIKNVAEKIKETADHKKSYRFMEVCGTHTMSIARFWLKHLLPPNIKMLSGPGCPVCVTPTSFIDKAIAYAGLKDTIIVTFGDMVKVPGSVSSLQEVRAEIGNVKVVYSVLDALKLASKNSGKRIVFLGVGFETTAPTIAAAILEAKGKGLDNFFVLSGHKVMPPALKALVKDRGLKIDGFILPAHVSTIIGARPYAFLSERYGISNVIAGFEPLDIMQGIYMLIKQINEREPKVDIQYSRAVKTEGNKAAQDVLRRTFDSVDAEWRGLGVIKASGLKIKSKFSRVDAEKNFKVNLPKVRDAADRGCICADVLKGLSEPKDCRLFAKGCTPEHPIGPCMVSSEGTCSAWYLHS